MLFVIYLAIYLYNTNLLLFPYFMQVARLESQVIRYKTASEAAEKAEDELKMEKRKLQREVFIYKMK